MTLFLTSLFNMVSDVRFQDIICWNARGDGFVLKNVKQFESTVLPAYAKTVRYSSFLRSLSYYSFTKNTQSDFVEYSHPKFLRDNPDELAKVSRERPTAFLPCYTRRCR